MHDLIKSGPFLTPGDMERIRRLIEAATAANTRRAYASDLAYFWAWAHLAAGLAPSYPTPVALVARFVLDHTEGLAPDLDAALVEAGVKQRPGPHGIATVRRRITALSVAHRFTGVKDADNPCLCAPVRLLLAKARRVAVKGGWRPAKKKAATLDLLFTLLAACGTEKMIDLRDRALLYFAFSSGGRRRSEVAAARVEHLTAVSDGYLFHLESSKTDQDAEGEEKPLLGKAGAAVAAWLAAARITEGFLFRSITKGDRVTDSGIQPITVARIVQKRAAMAGLDPRLFGGHSLRSGFVTEAGMQGKPMGDIMALSGHKTVSVVSGYYQAGNALNNAAAKLAG